MTRTPVAIAVTIGALSAALLQPFAHAQPAPQTRMSWQAFAADPNRVKSFVKAVQVMKSFDTKPPTSVEYRRSWQYWGAMHSYYGPQSTKGTVQQAKTRLQSFLPQFAAFLDGVPDLVPPDSVAKAVWDKCQHSTAQAQAANFFGWHRMYLFFFERVLRAAAQDDTLRLPYWDYTNATQLGLPAEFGVGNDGNPANPPIFETRRSEGLNEGLVALNPQLTSIDSALTNPDFLGASGFEMEIEQGVHGNVHCAVGNTCPVPYMGAVPLAANDAIFWLHHANIDRMWDCWMQTHQLPAGTWQDQVFTFVDETGTRQDRKVKDFLSSAALGYTYDHVTDCGSAPVITTAGRGAPPAAAAGRGQTAGRGATAAIASAARVAVDKPLTTVSLRMPQRGPLNDTLGRAMAPTAGPRSIELVLSGITSDAQPGALIDVYLARSESGEGRQHVGTLNFFGMDDMQHNAMTRRYDVTRQVRALTSSGGTLDTLAVVLEASRGLTTAGARRTAPPPPTPGRASAPTIEFNPRANLRIQSIELRVRTR